MQKKWSLLVILVIALLGYSECQLESHNQEIVITFGDQSVTSDKAEETVLIVKDKLTDLGIDNIQTHLLESGVLKISYFSDSDTDQIQEALSSVGLLTLDKSRNQKHPGPSNSFRHQVVLVIQEIKGFHDQNAGVNGETMLIQWQELDRVILTHSDGSSGNLAAFASQSDFKNSINSSFYLTIKIGIQDYAFPEVRAGPLCSADILV